MKEEWLMPGAVVPVDVKTTAALVAEIKRLIEVIGSMALNMQPASKPLTDEQIMEMYNEPRSDAEMIEFARAIEAAHGIFPANSDCHGPDWTDRDGEYLK